MSRDPWDGQFWQPATLHKYLYVGGDPVNWWDPTGWDEEEDVEITGIESEGAVEGEEALAKEISCVYQTAADALDAVSSTTALEGTLAVGNLAVDFATCSAKAPKKSIPSEGPPNGFVEGPRRTRQYGPNGEPFYDFDKPHQGAQYPHVHEWGPGGREHPGRPYSPWPKGRDPL